MTVGSDIKFAEYVLFGSQKLSENVIRALKERRACFLANHGMIFVGTELKGALDIALVVESLAQQFMVLKSTGDLTTLNDFKMSDVHKKFENYSSWSK